jgi:tetratricopeptide (TPR) repeat protein
LNGHRSSLRPSENRAWAVLGLAAGTLAFFALTSAVSRAYASHVRGLVQEFRARGDTALAAGRAQEAVEAFESAQRYARSDRLVQMRLAEALILARRGEEARSHLLALWAVTPGDGRVNLQLARLAATAGRYDEAARHFDAAIHGSWESAADLERRGARQELIELYLRQGALSQAEAHLIALGPDLPKDVDTQTDLGLSFLRTSSPRRALAAFKAALASDPLSGRAAKGAGDASFRLADYAGARRYYRIAAQQLPEDADVERALATVDLVFMMDPYLPRLSTSDRARRLGLAWRTALSGLEACARSQNVVLARDAASPELPGAPPIWHAHRQLASFRTTLSAESLRREPDHVGVVMDAVLAATRLTEHCGPTEPSNEALLLIARRHGADER